MPPHPTPTALTEPFWRQLRENGRLTVQQCASCARRFFIPETTCPYCGSRQWNWVESSGVGAVYSCVVVHQTVSPDQPTPFVLAIVDLDEQWSILTHVVGCDPADVTIGTRVSFVPTRVDDDLTLPTFTVTVADDSEGPR